MTEKRTKCYESHEHVVGKAKAIVRLLENGFLPKNIELEKTVKLADKKKRVDIFARKGEIHIVDEIGNVYHADMLKLQQEFDEVLNSPKAETLSKEEFHKVYSFFMTKLLHKDIQLYYISNYIKKLKKKYMKLLTKLEELENYDIVEEKKMNTDEVVGINLDIPEGRRLYERFKYSLEDNNLSEDIFKRLEIETNISLDQTEEKIT